MDGFRGTQAVVAMLCWAAVPAAASAAPGIYLETGFGFGSFSGDDLTVVDLDSEGVPGDVPNLDPDECCSSTGAVGDIRAGVAIGGYVAPEFQFTFDVYSTVPFGSGAFLGGGARVFFMRILSLTGLPSDRWPIELSLGTTFGFTVIGQDLAFKGWYYGFDPKFEFRVTRFLDIGIASNIIVPQLDPFIYTDFGAGQGRCLDSTGQIAGWNRDPANPPPIVSESTDCGPDAQGPDTLFVAPRFTLNFHFSPIKSKARADES